MAGISPAFTAKIHTFVHSPHLPISSTISLDCIILKSKKMKTSNLKKTSLSIRLRPVIITIAFMVLSSCLTFETVQQDYLADPNSSFNVHLEVAVDPNNGNEIGFFGV